MISSGKNSRTTSRKVATSTPKIARKPCSSWTGTQSQRPQMVDRMAQRSPRREGDLKRERRRMGAPGGNKRKRKIMIKNILKTNRASNAGRKVTRNPTALRKTTTTIRPYRANRARGASRARAQERKVSKSIQKLKEIIRATQGGARRWLGQRLK